MSRISRLIATVGALCATLLLGVASAQQDTTKTEVKTFEVLAVSGNTVVARGPDGTKEYNLPKDFQMQMDGRPIAVSDLRPGMTVQATITTKTTTRPVTTTEIKNGEVMNVTAYSVIIKTDKGYQKFTPERLKSGDVMIYREGKEVHLSELKKGDMVSAMIVTLHPPTTVTEREIHAHAMAPKKVAPAPTVAAAPATPAPVAEAAPAPAPAAELPKTASQLPGLAILGLLALVSAAALTAIRRSRAAR